jgi:hypothetical protein
MLNVSLFLLVPHSVEADHRGGWTGLQARKERRRSKALIVKDRTLSAGATGAAAGKKLKASRKEQNIDENETGSSEEERERERKAKKAKKRSSKEMNQIIQAIPKARNVAESRLTVSLN